jgi:ribose-phosphate pyrophosphokinase
MAKRICLISGSANNELSKEISEYLKIPLTPAEIKKFNDGESYVHIEKSVRGANVFVIQPTSPDVNDHVMELLIMIDALKRASAKEITAVIPYYGYSRQDRKSTAREPISAKLVADLLEKAGVNRVVTFDLHVDQIQGFFNVPEDNLEALPLIAEYIIDKKLNDIVIVAPDVGGTKRARRLAQLLEVPLAIIDKRRPKHGEVEVMNIIGDVDGKTVLIVDDIIDSAGTISSAAKALKEKGAKEAYICATHGLLTGPAIERLSDPDIKEVILTNTIKLPKDKMIDKIKVISVAPLLAEGIKRIYEGEPMGVLLNDLYSRVSEKR